MRPSRQLVDLLERHAELATRDRKLLSEDQRLSLRFYQAELAALDGTGVSSPSDRVSVWIRNVTAVEEFVAANGDLPRVNRRRPSVEIDPEIRRLEQWLNHETRPSTISVRCGYQLDRLAVTPGFSAHRLDDRWREQYEAYERFLASHPGPPVLRSDDSGERALANWAAKQRQHRRNGSLPEDRVAALDGLRIWAWSPPRK
jgi:hypothetical protein